MSQSNQAGWEWMAQNEERWHVENIKDFDHANNVSELAAARPMFDQLDKIFSGEFEGNK